MTTAIRPLGPELQEKAIRDLNENPGRIKDDLKHVKEWLKKQPHINARTDDQFLLAFLRGCKFSLERTKEKLDMYYTMRTLLPEFFSNRDPLLPEIQELLKIGVLLPMPMTESASSPRVLLLRNGIYGSSINISDLFKLNMMITDILLIEDDSYVVAGQYVFQDFSGFSLKHSHLFSPALMKKAMTCFEKAFPIRPQSMMFVNIPTFFEVMHSMLRPFLGEKTKSRMKLYGSQFDEVYKTVPQRLLPEEYGGSAGTLEELAATWKRKVESYRDFFLQDEVHKTVESKRPGKPKSSGEMFGIEGSFRKLTVD